MKQAVIIAIVLAALMFTLPLVTVVGKPDDGANTTGAEAVDPGAGAESDVAAGLKIAAGATDDTKLIVKVKTGDSVEEMRLNDYLYGVLAAEMPATFPAEALKAQAVAARTLTYNRILLNESGKGDPVHAGADICTDFRHCEAWLSPSEAAERWGDKAAEYAKLIRDAVDSTNGMVILYAGKPIIATFHSASSGATERAADVWGGDVPYLQSVESPGEAAAPRYYGIAEIKPEDIKQKILAKYPEAKLDADPSAWFGNEERTTSGGVVKINVGGVDIRGSVIREMFSLNSSNFSVTFEDGVFAFHTVGFGHGVGMSQYGARAMAQSGKNYVEILKWYYTDVEIGSIAI